ncbi:hypothetical protein NDU88_002535 [Pleurodeles waltl]|uniref:Uncharacterized protein n=1 Tax=Pleurodeles waltl TaxID=8319 RepID=A0AAV7SE13_PLEWA|nr:hypothetical protein NDU88_002535 [Pleurodeles waltl]
MNKAEMSDILNEITVTKAEAVKIYMETAVAKFLSHCQKCYEYIENVGKQLALKIRQKITNSNISVLEDEDGQLASGGPEILEVFSGFYQNLYSQEAYPQEGEVSQYMVIISVGQLQEGDKSELEAPLLDKEIGIAVSTLASGKAAGADQIPL